MFLFIFVLAKGFSYLGQLLKSGNSGNYSHQFVLWTIGASLFAHAVTMISVSYFDQSFIFPYMSLALIGSIWSVSMKAQVEDLPKINNQSSID